MSSDDLAAELQIMALNTQLEDLAFTFSDPNEDENAISLLGIQALGLLVDRLLDDATAMFHHESKCADCDLDSDEIFAQAAVITDLTRGAAAVNVMFRHRMHCVEELIAEQGEGDVDDVD